VGQSDDRLEVDDLADAWDLDGADLISDGGREPRSAVWADIAKRWARRHARALGVVGAVVVVATLAVAGWTLTHPPTFFVPAISVTLVSPTTTDGQVQIVRGDGSVLPPVVVHLTVDVAAETKDGVRLVFEGVSGPGVSMPASAPVPVEGASARVQVSPALDCASWREAASLLASFRVSDGTAARTVTVPVRLGGSGGRSLTDAVSSSCAPYFASTPLHATSVIAEADPSQPVVHLTWTLRNDAAHAWTLDGESTGSLTSDLPLTPTSFSPVELAGMTTRTVTSSVAIEDCAPLGSADPSSYSVDLNGHNGAETQDVSLPSDDMVAVLAAATAVCQGAPEVSHAEGTVSSHGSGASATVTIAVRAHIAGTASWNAFVPTPSWWNQEPTAAAFPDARQLVRAPGTLSLSFTARLGTCVDSTQVLPLVVMLRGSGGRAYPFTVDLDADAGIACPASGG
jgi:hypothetical protein